MVFWNKNASPHFPVLTGKTSALHLNHFMGVFNLMENRFKTKIKKKRRKKKSTDILDEPKSALNPLRLGFLNYYWGKPSFIHMPLQCRLQYIPHKKRKGNAGCAHIKAQESPWRWFPREPHAVEVTSLIISNTTFLDPWKCCIFLACAPH